MGRGDQSILFGLDAILRGTLGFNRCRDVYMAVTFFGLT